MPKYNSTTVGSRRPYTVIVEGNIGAGKTTFLQPFLKHEKIVQVCTEPVEKWRNLQGHNLLQKMYQDPKRWSFELQSYIQLTMVQEHMKPCNVPVKMMERSLLRFAIFHIKTLLNFLTDNRRKFTNFILIYTYISHNSTEKFLIGSLCVRLNFLLTIFLYGLNLFYE